MEKLSDFIKESGMPQSEFAARLGLSAAFVSQILSGKRRPSYNVMLQISDETGGNVPLDAWRAGEPREGASQ